MKTIINLVLLAIIIGGAVYFYEQNRDELNETLDSVKNASVESVTSTVVEKVKNIDPDELIELVSENKDQILKLMHDHNIDINTMNIEELKQTLQDQGVSLDNIDIEDESVQQKIKDALNTASE